MLDEPTRGIDVGTKQEIYRSCAGLARPRRRRPARSRPSCPSCSACCDRVLVMVDGRIAAEFDGGGLTEEAVMAVASGAELVSQ